MTSVWLKSSMFCRFVHHLMIRPLTRRLHINSFTFTFKYSFPERNTPYPPLGLTWTVMLVWRKENINRSVSVLCSISAMHNRSSSSLSIALSPPSTSVSSDFMVICKCFFNYTYFTLPGGIGPLPCGLINYCPAVLWHCWLGHLTRKIIPDIYDL